MFELSEAQQAVQSSIRRFARRELRWRVRKLDTAPPGTIDWDFLRKCCTFGLIAGQLPEPYGSTMDRLSAVIALEEIARWDGGMATLLAANSLAQAAIAWSQNDTLMAQIFPEIATREAHQDPVLVALALTERRLGSDLVNPLQPRGTPMMVTARSRGDAYILSGRKAYCAGGNIARWLCVFATLREDRSPAGLTGFVVPTSAPGFHVSEVLPMMGLRGCPLVEFYLENVMVPRQSLLTPAGQAYGLLSVLSAHGRCQGAAIAVGIAQGALELARQHTLHRIQGDSPLACHQMVQHTLADMLIQIEAARLLTYKAAATEPPDLALSSMAKVFASDMAVKVTTDAVQLMGAYGTTIKSGAEKYFRDAKMTQIYEGTNDMCRLAITAPFLQEAGLLPKRG